MMIDSPVEYARNIDSADPVKSIQETCGQTASISILLPMDGGVRYLQTDGAANGLVFVQFISLLLRCKLMNKIKNNKDTKGKLWYPDVMNELSKLKASKMGDK